jgi:hypothetical protein
MIGSARRRAPSYALTSWSRTSWLVLHLCQPLAPNSISSKTYSLTIARQPLHCYRLGSTQEDGHTRRIVPQRPLRDVVDEQVFKRPTLAFYRAPPQARGVVQPRAAHKDGARPCLLTRVLSRIVELGRVALLEGVVATQTSLACTFHAEQERAHSSLLSP